MALLREMHCIPMGSDAWINLPRKGGVAFAAQESWVQNETIKVRLEALVWTSFLRICRTTFSLVQLMTRNVIRLVSGDNSKWYIFLRGLQ